MLDYDKQKEKILKYSKAFKEVLEKNDIWNYHESNYIYWSQMNIIQNKYDSLVIDEFALNVDFEIFKKSLEIFDYEEFIYYNQSSIDTQIIVNFLDNGFEVAGTRTFNQMYFDESYRTKKGLLIRRIR